METKLEIEALQERFESLRLELQKECKHKEVIETEDLGVRNTYLPRVCTGCGLEEQVWIDEQGQSSGYKILGGAEGRIIRVALSVELLHYKELRHIV
jgi:hypothetical protein